MHTRYAEIQTKRLHLRPIVPEDLEAIHTVLGDWNIGRRLSKGRGNTWEESVRWVNKVVEHWQEYGFGTWAVIRREDGAFMGYCGLNTVSELNEIEVLYGLSPQYWGQGFATEAARASVDYGLNTLGLAQIIGLTKLDNAASVNVLQKSGLHFIRQTEVFHIECNYFEIRRDYR